MVTLEVFPGQGSKIYDSPTPEAELFEDTLASHDELLLKNPYFEADYLFPYSYGIYAAMVVAGVASEQDAFKMSKIRADLVRKAEKTYQTGMASVFGIDRKCAQSLAERLDLFVSNYNGKACQVLAGRIENLMELEEEASSLRIKVKRLPMSAFHCPLREAESHEYALILKNYKLKNPLIPMISSTSPRVMREAEDIREELSKQMVRPVELVEVVSKFYDLGIDNIVESGEDNIKKLISRINPAYK